MPRQPTHYIIREVHTEMYITDEYTLESSSKENAQVFTSLPVDIGEEPYPSELTADKTAYEDMGGGVTHYVTRVFDN